MKIESSSSYSYSREELRQVWKDRFDSLDPYFALVQWAKRENLLDDPGAIRTLRSIIENMEEMIESKNGDITFDQFWDLTSHQSVRKSSSPHEIIHISCPCCRKFLSI